MTIEQLEFALEVAKTRSINLAADTLFLSQSRVSASIIKLEEELGQALFIRSNKGIEITPFGKEFLPYARSVVEQFRQIQAFAGAKAIPAQQLTICNNHFSYISELAASLYEKHKAESLRVFVKNCSRQECIELVSNHSAEIGFCRIWNYQKESVLHQFKSKDVCFYPLHVSHIVAVVGKNNPLFSRKENTIALAELNPFPPIIQISSLYNPLPNLYAQLPQIRVGNFIGITDYGTSNIMLEKTDGFVLTNGDDSAVPKNNKRIFRISDCDYTCQIGWIKQKNTELSPLAREYVDMLAEYIQMR